MNDMPSYRNNDENHIIAHLVNVFSPLIPHSFTIPFVAFPFFVYSPSLFLYIVLFSTNSSAILLVSLLFRSIVWNECGRFVCVYICHPLTGIWLRTWQPFVVRILCVASVNMLPVNGLPRSASTHSSSGEPKECRAPSLRRSCITPYKFNKCG